MKISLLRHINSFLLAVVATSLPAKVFSQDLLVRPARGGGVDTNAPMIHVDIFYDYSAHKMHATLDTSHGVPHMLPLPEGYAFAASSNYSVLNGKAYSLQYAWNPGGIFAPPPNAAVWIECLSSSPGLENYDGPGNKNENPPRPYTPILGAAGSPKLWRWYGRMAHNAYAVHNPVTAVLTAEYRVFFGDQATGARDAFLDYDEATVTLTWTVDPVPEPLLLDFGAAGPTQGAPLVLHNSRGFVAESGYLVNLVEATSGPRALQFEGEIPMRALPATEVHGGPLPGHAAQGACLELEMVSLDGPSGGQLRYWEPGETQARWALQLGGSGSSHRIRLSANEGHPGADPYGQVRGRLFTVDRAGLYRLGFRAVDVSTNGADSGPVHTPSDLYVMYLQAGLTVNSLVHQGAVATASFGGMPGTNFYLERAVRLGGSASWQAVAGPLRGMNRLQTLADFTAELGMHFYRVRTSMP